MTRYAAPRLCRAHASYQFLMMGGEAAPALDQPGHGPATDSPSRGMPACLGSPMQGRGAPIRAHPVRWRRRVRGGYVLVWWVLLVFALMGLAALVIDLGLVRLAQRQMQTAADLAALESLRERDQPAVPPSQRESHRRRLAADLVTLLFDDDLQPGPDALGLGAGMQLPLEPSVYGDPSLDASRLLRVDAAAPYKPALELNYPQNAQHGDLVAGSYVPSQAPTEAPDYARADFVPAAGDDERLQQAPAMLARLRRTNDLLGLDRQSGVSSAGPALPVLFGRGGLVPATAPGGGYSWRHHGFTVRATAIAQLVPALSVGAAAPAPQVPAAAPFALVGSRWDALGPGVRTRLRLATGGGTGGDIDGFTYVPAEDAPAGVLSFGAVLVPSAGPGIAAGTEVYVPLVVREESGGSAAWWVVAFGLGRVESWQPIGDGVEAELVKNPEGRQVAHANASGALAGKLGATLVADGGLFARLWNARGQVQAPLLVPVLVR